MSEHIHKSHNKSLLLYHFVCLIGYRKKVLTDAVADIFKQVVLLLAEEGLVKLKEVYTDGTKIESVAGRYTFVG